MTGKPKDGSPAGASGAGAIHAEHGAVAAGTIQHSLVQIFNATAPVPSGADAQALEAAYLHRLCSDCGALDWLRSFGYQDRETPTATLGAVYTPLRSNRTAATERLPERDGSAALLPVLAVLDTERHLVLTGDPGSGKSAFADFTALCLAGERLRAQAPAGMAPCAGPGLHQLTEPLPDDDGAPEKDAPRQPWSHGALLPLRVLLREFAASTCFPADGERGDAGALLRYIADDLAAKGQQAFLPLLWRHLNGLEPPGAGVLLVLDGLDEVPHAGERRARLVQCIRGLAASLPRARVLVTCRPYAYARPEWRIRGFAEVALAPFDAGQIRHFVGRWYATRDDFAAPRRRERAEDLSRNLLARPALRELAERPLLLTLTAYLHGTGQDLPERRAALYDRLLALLIEHWERARFLDVQDGAGARQRAQYSLAEALDVGMDELRLVLERRAFEAHAAQQGRDGTADIPASALNNDLLFIKRRDSLPAAAAGEAPRPIDARLLGEYLRERVGILHQRGGSDERDAVYSFPHRSFQEFLAAEYLNRDEAALYERFPAANSDNWVDLAAWLARTDPDRWREVVLLAAGGHANKAPAWALARALYPEREAEAAAETAAETAAPRTAADAWGLRLAAEVLAECLPRQNLNPPNARTRERVRRDLPRLLAASTLPAAERVAAGLHLARLDDPRPGALTLDAMEFCRVPAGRFFLGAPDDEGWLDAKTGAGPHRLGYGYWLARWPLTVAQWRAYLAAAGREAEHANSLRAPANTPVVRVSWHEAMACVDWLTGHWQGRGLLPPDWRVTLPSEPEWEQAAKGGERIPAPGGALIRPLSEITTDIDGDAALIRNPEPWWRYPWGDAPDTERMNIEWDIGRVSPVGCYAAGASPYGCEELAGNVWEWTRSRREPYPYPEDAAGRAAREDPSGLAGRVLRGGAFNVSRGGARCSSRGVGVPVGRHDNVGLRLCLSPSIRR